MESAYYEYDWDSKYCYPNQYILRNKLNIKDQDILNEAEQKITALKILELKMNPIKGNLGVKHLLGMHKFIFCDIYSWAGKIRTVNISKGNDFCRCLFIIENLEVLFSKLQNENYLIGLSKKDAILRISYYLGELNAIHPFREGNGRSQRAFIEILAQVAGYYIDFSNVTARDMIEASSDAFNQDYQKMDALIEKIISEILLEEQELFIHKITTKNSPLRNIWNESRGRNVK